MSPARPASPSRSSAYSPCPFSPSPLDVAFSGRRAVCTAELEHPPQFWGGYTGYGCADRVERGVMLAGNRLDTEGSRRCDLGRHLRMLEFLSVLNSTSPDWCSKFQVKEAEES